MTKENTIDRETMRKRGWSIHSEASEGKDELNNAEKKALFESYPIILDDSDGAASMDNNRPRKRKMKENDVEIVDNIRKEQIEAAKGKLSKWAARLFDPNRPRGLVEAPKVIPLNDEFLQAFGKREREFDQALGRTIDIDTSTLDDENERDDESERDEDSNLAGTQTTGATHGCKVKIVNLAYTTTLEVIQQACAAFGPLKEINLPMDKDTLSSQHPRNVGRVYVTYESCASAEQCIQKLTNLQGRPLRATLVDDTPRKSRKSVGNGGARYWETDISTKCFRCGQIGHLAVKCPNEAKAIPCALCGNVDHDIRDCALGRTCFKCGAPGHISRDCKERFPVQRMVCGICFESGHHRVQCRRDLSFASSQDAVCMVCHQKGHFMCQEMKWFFGLDGVTCFNCGRMGHHGYDCERPRFEEFLRDEELIRQEIDRAEAATLADKLESMQSARGRDQQRNMDRNRLRPKSQPPARIHRGDSAGVQTRVQGPPVGARMYTPKNGGGGRSPERGNNQRR